MEQMGKENVGKEGTEVQEPEVLSLDMVKAVYDYVIVQASGEINGHTVSCLEMTALDIDNVCDLVELLQRKRYALECLRVISFEFPEEFILIFYDSIVTTLQLFNPDLIENAGQNKLYDFINSPASLKEKLLLLQSFIICLCESDVNFSLFEQFPVHFWRRKMLLYALLKINDGLDIVNVETVTREIEELNEFFIVSGFHWCVDDFLEKLISYQKKYFQKVEKSFVREVFIAIRLRPEIYYILEQGTAVLQDRIDEIKYLALVQHCTYAEFLSENDFETLQYILNLPLPVVLGIVSNLTRTNFEAIITFVALLRNSGMEQTIRNHFLLSLDYEDNIDILKYKLIFQIIKTVISVFFSNFNSYKGDEMACNSVQMCDSCIKCRCFDGKAECQLHNTLQCCALLHSLNCKLARIMLNFANTERLVDIVNEIIAKIDNSKQILVLVNALEILEEYDIELGESEFSNLFLDFLSENWERQVHQTVIESSFSGTYEKSAEQAIDEIENYNPQITEHIIELFIDVNSAYENRSCLFENGDCINAWSESQIKLWALLARKASVSDSEKLAVLKRLVSVTAGFCLRDVQLLAVISIIKSNCGKGRLCQVNTGEGKTVIIAMVAAFKVLEGRTVDVYTSSPVLAIPQSLEFKNFFRVCEISVTNNIGPKSDYNYDVIYGTNTSFQRDVLEDEFRKSDIRKNRKFDVAIVDEVDNMLIDGNNWILKLTRDVPGMDHLEIVLSAIYIQVKAVACALIEKNGNVYLRQEEEMFAENGSIKQEVKYRDIPIEGTKRDFIIKCTINHIRKLIRDSENENVEENYPEIKLPRHLREVVSKKQIHKWIENAVQSIFNYVQDEDYILYNGKITIVDTSNTGVLKKNSSWSNGLHQFLQMKHGAKVEPENFTSNFISNVALFSRYSSIYGLTGTLGSKDTKTFLHETYDVDTVVIPPFKHKQHKILKPVILSDRKSWLFQIAQNCIQKLQKGRSVLIIMKYIKETDELAMLFKEHFGYDNAKIKLYKTEDNSGVVEMPMTPGDVIITTNIAGRGTDIKLNKTVEENGGLHVCLTFLPKNSRVEEQNTGRTSRNGNRGTSQLILHDPRQDVSIDALKIMRSEQETSHIKMATNTVKRIKIKDNIFRRFCSFLNEIQGRNSVVRECELKSVEEQFGIWMKIYEDEFDEANSEILDKFEEFRLTVLEDDRKGTLIKNAYMYVQLGNSYLEKNEYVNAISEYSRAISLDENFAENAFYNRAWAYLKLYGNNVKENIDFIEKAISDFKAARKLIYEKEKGLHLMQTASSSDVFSEQIINKLNLYNLQKNLIEMAIGPDKDAVNEQLKELELHLKEVKDLELKKKLLTLQTKLKEDKENIGVIRRAIQNKRDIKIEPLSNDFIPKEDRNKCENEIEEFERNGWLQGFKIVEIKPIDWLSVFGLLGIGLGQLIIGAAITVFSLGTGSSIGMGFISEGVSDIITAVKDGIIKRDFNWATWALMKVISLTVSVVCAGLKAIKDVARTAYSGVRNIATSGIKAFNKVTTEGWKIAAKKLGFELSKGVAKEIVTEMVNYGIDKSLMPTLEEAIIELIRDPIENALSNNSKVLRMLKLDAINNNHAYENQIRAIGLKLLSPKENTAIKQLALHTVSCLTGNLGLGTIHKVLTILKGSVDFGTFTRDFITQLNKAINDIQLKEDNKEDSIIRGQVEKKEIIEESVNQLDTAADSDGDVDLNKVRMQPEQVQQKRMQCTTPSDLSYSFAGVVSTNMIQIMKGSIVSPITQMAVNYTVDGLSSKVNKSLESQKEKFRAGKRVCDANDRKYENISVNDTIGEISEEHFEEVKTLIDQIEAGGPVTLFHLGALSKAADTPIEVYDHNGDLIFPVRNNVGGTPIKIQYHGIENNVGHFTLLGKNEPLVVGSGDNMCAFNCVAQLCNKDPNQLKIDTVNILRNNQHVVAARLYDIKMLETTQNSVFGLKGGAKYYGKNYLDAMQYISSSEGKYGFGNINPGHPEIHISYKGDPKIRLAMLSDAIGKKIIIKDKKKNEMFTTGSHYGGEPIVLQLHVDRKDPNNSYFSEVGGTEKLYFNESNHDKLYSYIGKTINQTPASIKTATTLKLDQLKIPRGTTCVENKPATSKPPTGFFTKEDEAFVLDHVLKSKVVETKLTQLNRYKVGSRDGRNFTKIALNIPVQDLNLQREVSVGQWLDEKLICKFPLKSVFVLLQHHDGHESNPKAQVHIQTIYPPY